MAYIAGKGRRASETYPEASRGSSSGPDNGLLRFSLGWQPDIAAQNVGSEVFNTDSIPDGATVVSGWLDGVSQFQGVLPGCALYQIHGTNNNDGTWLIQLWVVNPASTPAVANEGTFDVIVSWTKVPVLAGNIV